MGILERVAQILESGSIENIGLQQRLTVYKKREKRLSENFSTSNTVGNDEYMDNAGEVADMWVNLVVDIATFCGEPLEEAIVKDVRQTVFDSVEDSVGYANDGLVFA